MSVKAIVFDHGGVIDTKDGSSDPEARERLAKSVGLENAKKVQDLVYKSDAWKLCKVGKLSRKDMYASVCPTVGVTTPEAQEEFARSYVAGVGLSAEMRELLQALKAAGQVKMLVLSNYDDTLEERLRSLGAFELFDMVLNSYEIGAAKPDTRSFEIAIERAGLPANQILMVDDKKSNTDVAESLGMKGHEFKSVAGLKACLADLGLTW